MGVWLSLMSFFGAQDSLEESVEFSLGHVECELP